METDPTQTLPAPPTCPRPGMSLGPYVLDRPLGKGGMASVWLGHHHLIGAPLAIKILDPRTASEPGLVARFLREARLAGNIRHPTLVPVHDVGCDAASGLNYMVMDYLPGGSAADLLRRHHGTLPETDAVRIVLRVAEALCQAERHDLVHRDIKPDNILFDEGGEAKLADLGIAKARQAIGPEVTATLTLTSEIRATASASSSTRCSPASALTLARTPRRSSAASSRPTPRRTSAPSAPPPPTTPSASSAR